MPPTSSHFPKSTTALLIVDVINPLDFPGGEPFLPRARRTVRAIAALAARARRAGVPVLFVNDNLGRWRSNIDELIERVRQPGVTGAPLIDLLSPHKSDYVVLKSTLSGFHQTPLEAMLRLGGVKTLVITGFVTGNCVLFTAADAYMRDYKVVIPSDCVADLSREDERRALQKLQDVLHATIRTSKGIRWRR